MTETKRKPRKDKGIPRRNEDRAIEILFSIYQDMIDSIIMEGVHDVHKYFSRIQQVLTDINKDRVNKIMSKAIDARNKLDMLSDMQQELPEVEETGPKISIGPQNDFRHQRHLDEMAQEAKESAEKAISEKPKERWDTTGKRELAG